MPISVVLKALNGIQWEVAHPLPLNYGAPIASMDATMCVSSGGTPPSFNDNGWATSHWIPLKAFD